MPITAVLFDLDGTLADTLADITASLNVALAAFGLPAVSQQAAAACVGWGVRRLLGEDREALAAAAHVADRADAPAPSMRGGA